jgi:hypothetical protein
MKKRAFAIIGAIALAAVSLGACQGGSAAQQSSNNNDVQTSAKALQQLQRAQPTPLYQYSQQRQTLIAIENAQAGNTQTTSFFFNMGIQDPINSCPSIGFPIASTTELTNPLQDNNNGPNGNAGVAIGQVDPTGVYSGNSTGTYVLCVSPSGGNFIQYWEGFVDNVTGPAVWNTTTHQVQLTGPSSVAVKTKPGA